MVGEGPMTSIDETQVSVTLNKLLKTSNIDFEGLAVSNETLYIKLSKSPSIDVTKIIMIMTFAVCLDLCAVVIDIDAIIKITAKNYSRFDLKEIDLEEFISTWEILCQEKLL
jgi:hypothetical protein